MSVLLPGWGRLLKKKAGDYSAKYRNPEHAAQDPSGALWIGPVETTGD
ncbi:hypothetical protein [Microbulbifer halophilus]